MILEPEELLFKGTSRQIIAMFIYIKSFYGFKIVKEMGIRIFAKTLSINFFITGIRIFDCLCVILFLSDPVPN